MKNYIIDLGLEFGIRTKLAVLVIKQFETKRKREKGGVLLSLRWPLLFLMAGQTPPPRASPLSCCSSSSSSSPSPCPTTKLPKPPIFGQPARKSLDFASPSSNQPFDVKSRQNRRQATMISVELGCNSSPRRKPKFCHAIPFLIALNPL